MSHQSAVLLLLLALMPIFIWSATNPRDLFTWHLGAAPVILGVFILATAYRKFQLTTLSYLMIWTHAVILLIGAHYTYAEVPLFNWLRDVFESKSL